MAASPGAVSEGFRTPQSWDRLASQGLHGESNSFVGYAAGRSLTRMGNASLGHHGAVRRLHQRSRRWPAIEPTATTGSAASVYQVATKSGESSKQWKA
jgi:hypothetical protein